MKVKFLKKVRKRFVWRMTEAYQLTILDKVQLNSKSFYVARFGCADYTEVIEHLLKRVYGEMIGDYMAERHMRRYYRRRDKYWFYKELKKITSK